MKKKLLLIGMALLIPLGALAQQINGVPDGLRPSRIPLGTGYNVGQVFSVGNGASATDCTVGGGTTAVVCLWNGSAWTALGSGGGSGANVTLSNLTSPTAINLTTLTFAGAGGLMAAGDINLTPSSGFQLNVVGTNTAGQSNAALFTSTVTDSAGSETGAVGTTTGAGLTGTNFTNDVAIALDVYTFTNNAGGGPGGTPAFIEGMLVEFPELAAGTSAPGTTVGIEVQDQNQAGLPATSLNAAIFIDPQTQAGCSPSCYGIIENGPGPNVFPDNQTIGYLTAQAGVANSPYTRWTGTYQATSGPTYGLDYWSLQNVIGAGVNGTSTLTYAHTGSSGIAKVSFPGTVSATSFSGAGTGLTGSAASFNAGTATNLQNVPMVNCSTQSGADDSLKIQACFAALYALNTRAGIADARGLTGNVWSINPFVGGNIPNGGWLLLPPGNITISYVPIVAHDNWSIQGMTPNSDAGIYGSNVQGSVLVAGSSFPPTYSTGTVTMGTSGLHEVITGVSTAWSANTTGTGNIAVGCAFVSPAGGSMPNSTYGIISSITNSTTIVLGFGVNNGTGAAGGSTYDIYCPVYVHGDGAPEGNGYEYGMAAVDVGFSANNIAGVVPEMNWYGGQGTYASFVRTQDFCGIGFDLETNYSQNSGPWSNIMSVPGTCATSGVLPFVVASNIANFGLYNLTTITGPGATPAVGVDVQGSHIKISGVDVEGPTVGVSVNASTACIPACAQTAYGGGTVEIDNVHGSGTTAVHLSNAAGNNKNSILRQITGELGFTNDLIDDTNGCTIPSATEGTLGEYALSSSGTIESSSSRIGSCMRFAPILNTPSAATTTNIGATNMVASTSAIHDYNFSWTVSLTAAGTACTGSTTVVLNAIFTDPNASGSTTQALGTITIASLGVGSVGFVAGGVDNILAKKSTAVQYSTTNYTLGTGCTGTNPTYQVTPTLVQLW